MNLYIAFLKIYYMTKRYIADSIVTLSLSVGRIPFYPNSKGGSYYVTSNSTLIEALERHPSYGRLFREDKIFAAEMRVKESEPTLETKQDDTEPVKVYKEVATVTNCSDATIYLQEYGVNGLRSKKDITEAAELHGIRFPNLK